MRLLSKRLVRFRRWLRLAGSALVLSATVACAQPSLTNTCTVDGKVVYQRIDGFGAASAFGSGWTTGWADLFFSTNSGVGLSLVRNRIAPDGTTPDWSMMQMAQARGARVWSTPWSPPGAYKSSGIVNGGNFDSDYNQAYASQLAGYVLNMRTNYNVNIYAVSVQNEPDYSTLAYESCSWSSQQIHDFIPYFYQALSNNGVASTKILIAEEGLWQFDLAATAMDDLTTSNQVGILAAHDYDYSVAPVPNQGKPLWETEVSAFGDFDGSITNGLYWANQIHDFMTGVQANAFNYFYLIGLGPDDNEGLTDIYGNPGKRLYAFGQFSRFVRPGFYRIGAAAETAALISAYQDPASGSFAIVAINTNTAGVTEIFSLTNFTAGAVTPWITSATLSLSNQAAVSVVNGAFSYALPPQSVVTFVGGTNFQAAVTQPPQDETVQAGQNAAFTVSASGALPLAYLWQQNGVSIAGATNATYGLTNVPASASGSQFRCVVSNVYGASTSSVAVLTVTLPACAEPPPGIVAWWADARTGQDIVGGNNLVLMYGVGFTNAFAGYGFVLDGVSNYLELPLNLIPAANANPFSLELWFQTTGGGVILGQQYYQPQPFGNAGPNWVPELYVGTNGILYAQMFWNGSYEQISTSQPVNDGAFHHLAVTYDGVNELVYLDGVQIGRQRMQYSTFAANFSTQLGTGYTAYWPAGNGGWYSFHGVLDQPTLYTNALTAAQVQAIYNAGSIGKCSDEMLPAIIVQPADQTAAVGATAIFSLGATSLLPLTYQWFRGSAVVPGATNATYFLTPVTVSLGGSGFACVVANANGSITSSVAFLTLAQPGCAPPPPGIVAWWSDGSTAVDLVGGYDGVLENGAGFTNALVGNGFAFAGGTGYVQLPPALFPFTNAGPFSFELWFETTAGGVILAQQNGTPPPAGGALTAGWLPYVYVGTDGNLRVQMFWDGTVNDQITTSTPVNDGLYHHVAVTYDGTNEMAYLDGAEIGVKSLPYSNLATNWFLQFGTGYTEYWPAGNGGWYAFDGVIDQPTLYSNALTAAQVLAIYNAGGAGKCMNVLQPVIVAQPTNQTIPAGATAVFSVSATSPLPLSYQWLTGATAVTGATNAALGLTNVPASLSGSQFSCVIASAVAVITSSTATLTVTTTPPVLSPIANRVVNAGVTLTITNVATDSDLWAQTLSFNLVTAPAGAALNASSGIFTWRPAVAQANSTYLTTLKVTDSGTPPLSATQSFSILVNPLPRPALGLSRLTNGWLLSVTGPAGPDYSLQGASNLLNWSTLTASNSPALPFNWTDSNKVPARFYRVLIGP